MQFCVLSTNAVDTESLDYVIVLWGVTNLDICEEWQAMSPTLDGPFRTFFQDLRLHEPASLQILPLASLFTILQLFLKGLLSTYLVPYRALKS